MGDGAAIAQLREICADVGDRDSDRPRQILRVVIEGGMCGGLVKRRGLLEKRHQAQLRGSGIANGIEQMHVEIDGGSERFWHVHAPVVLLFRGWQRKIAGHYAGRPINECSYGNYPAINARRALLDAQKSGKQRLGAVEMPVRSERTVVG